MMHFMTDREVANVLGVSTSWVCKNAKYGPRQAGGLDLRLAEPLMIGRQRRWLVENIENLLHIKINQEDN